MSRSEVKKRKRGRPPGPSPFRVCMELLGRLTDQQLILMTDRALQLVVERRVKGKIISPESVAAVTAFETARKFL